jgi:serine/threonine protein kinase
MPVDNLSAAMQTIGSYDLLEKIAEGGMGTVYRGRHRDSGDLVAIKVVPSHLLSNPVVLKRFEQEYLAARQIDHPNIVKAIDFGREDDTRYLVMELVNGESLGQKIERDGRMKEDDALRVVVQVAEALGAAHTQGMIHRDVKPDNILVTSEGVAKLTDLGLVKELETDLNLTRTGRGLGTPHFMAPEQFRNAKNADARCDIYSLGASLYMMVTGELPFQSNGPLDAWMKKLNNDIDPPCRFVPDLSERVDWAIRRAMSPDPKHRPQSCRELIEDLTGHSTTKITGTQSSIDGVSEYWYLVYADRDGLIHTVKGTIKGVRRSVRDGMLGDPADVRVARTKAGPFEPLMNFPEFRDLIIEPAVVPAQAATGSRGQKSTKSLHAVSTKTAVPTADEPGELGTTTILPSAIVAKPVVPRGPSAASPRIELPTPRLEESSTETWKWVVQAIVFLAIGIGATLVLPTVLRYIRFMEF